MGADTSHPPALDLKECYDQLQNKNTDLSPVDYLAAGSNAYSRRYGFAVPDINLRRVVADAERGKCIAAAYLAAPRFDAAALPAFRVFRDETLCQFAFLTQPADDGGLGVRVEVCKNDPYTDAATMMADLRKHRQLKVYATAGSGNEHPFLTNDENDMFRAVHDAFGHASIGAGFDPDGEEAAWLKHSFMYSPLARQALTTETRGQTSTFFFHFQGQQFAEQKVALLPEEFRDNRNVSLRDVETEADDG